MRAVMWKFLHFVLETHGQSIATTAKIACNKTVYLINRAVGRRSSTGLVHAEWHWAKHPFSLRQRVLWSSALPGWFMPEDESAIECMLHMPAYEPVGWDSIQAGRAVGNSGRVVTLEPDAANRKQLERNLALNKLNNVQIFPLAIWSRSGNVGWLQGEEPVWHKVGAGGELTQESISIDALVDMLRLSRLDWIKLDIEGGEVEALRGAVRTLRIYHPKLFIEIHETSQAVAGMLLEAGYTVAREHYDQPPDRHGWILAQMS